MSELILRRLTPPDRLLVRMWLYPVLTIAVAAGIAKWRGGSVEPEAPAEAAPA